jgi:UDP-N-acetylmuramoyl-L-alanyl-D-glutamate--2,6-diaminopimelate ligase
VEQAEAGDIILLAGKGHETYQLIGTRRVPFSEREILEEAIRERALAGIV